MHTIYCDGADTPETMIIEAIKKGFTAIGFSGHSYVPCEKGYCMSPQRTASYRRALVKLKEEYAGQIKVFCGTEQDILSDLPKQPYDYNIGSVHFVPYGDGFYPIDWTEEKYIASAKKLFGGDLVEYAVYYYSIVAGIYDKTKCNIIGHFDLPSKFNEDSRLYDMHDPRYVSAWQNAAVHIIEGMKADGKTPLFEINTGAISRGYRTEPYPSSEIMQYLKAKGTKFVLSSDAHSKENIGYGFEEWYDKLSKEGFEIINFLEQL